jgi:hypothetical protein
MNLIYNVKEGTPVTVEWLDSCRTLDERCKNDWEVVVTLHSCGFFVGEDEHSISIAQDINRNNKPVTYRNVLSIVKQNIVEFYEWCRQQEPGMDAAKTVEPLKRLERRD